MGHPKKIQNVLTLVHAYKFYKDKHFSNKHNLDYKTYRNICETFNKYIMDKIIEEGYFFKLPYRIGIIRVRKRDINLYNLKKDYGLFNESEGKYKNEHVNEHTNHMYVRFYWRKFYTDNMVRNKTLYSFIPTRTNKRRMAALLKEKGMEQMNKYFS